MMLLRRALFPLACAASLLCAPAAQPECVTARFIAEASFGGDELPTLTFDGRLTQSGPRLRIDAQNDLTMEHTVILGDAEAGELTVLFPDTLNGRRFRLADHSELTQLTLVREAIGGTAVEPPAEWKVSRLTAEEIDGVRCEGYRAEPAAGVSIEWWSGPDQRPRRVVAAREEVRFTVLITDYQSPAELDPALFSVGEDYTITEGEGVVAEQLPPR